MTDTDCAMDKKAIFKTAGSGKDLTEYDRYRVRPLTTRHHLTTGDIYVEPHTFEDARKIAEGCLGSLGPCEIWGLAPGSIWMLGVLEEEN